MEAAKRIEELQPDIIDINMGCSVKKVSERGSGGRPVAPPGQDSDASFTPEPGCPPATGKIRLGWDNDHLNYLDVVRAMQDNGASLVAVHGRTRDQGYSGKANWTPSPRSWAMPFIPVIGNGDVHDAGEEIADIKTHTGCTVVMVARGAIGYLDFSAPQPGRDPVWRKGRLHPSPF